MLHTVVIASERLGIQRTYRLNSHTNRELHELQPRTARTATVNRTAGVKLLLGRTVAEFCSNTAHFGIFQADPTFNLGLFSVTTTQYEHLLLLNRRSGKHLVMVGPIMVHHRKEKSTYKILANDIVARKPKLRNLLALGTDVEVALSDEFLDVCQGAKHLICFNHFQNNITDHLKPVGIDEPNRRLICADIFGQQVGTMLEEGIVDSDDVEEFAA